MLKKNQDLGPALSDAGAAEFQPGDSLSLLPSLIAVGMLILLSIMTFTSIPVMGLPTRGAAWLSLLAPGLCVGWIAVRGQRLAASIVLVGLGIILLASLGGYAGWLWLILWPLVYLATFGVGIALARVIPIYRWPRAIAAGVGLSLAAVVSYLWFVDGWRFVYAETDRIGRVVARDPLHLFLPQPEDWFYGLTQAAQARIARGDMEGASQVLAKAERAGAILSVLYRSNYLSEVAVLEVEAGADARAEALLAEGEPNVEYRKLVLIDGYLGRRDIVRAMQTANELSVENKFRAYRAIADKEGNAGRPAGARDAVTQMLRLADSSAEGVPADAYAGIAYTQAAARLYADAIATAQRAEVQDPIRTLEGVGRVALEKRQVDQARIAFAAALVRIQVQADARKRDDLLFGLGASQSHAAAQYIRDELSADAETTVALIQNDRQRENIMKEVARERGVIEEKRNLRDAAQAHPAL